MACVGCTMRVDDTTIGCYLAYCGMAAGTPGVVPVTFAEFFLGPVHNRGDGVGVCGDGGGSSVVSLGGGEEVLREASGVSCNVDSVSVRDIQHGVVSSGCGSGGASSVVVVDSGGVARGKNYRKNKKRKERKKSAVGKSRASCGLVSSAEQGRIDAEAALAQRKAELALARLSDPAYTTAHDVMLKRKMLAGTQAAVAKTEMWLSKVTSVSPSSSVSEAELKKEREERERVDRILANVSSVVASMPGDAFVDRGDRKKLVVALSEDPMNDEMYQCIEVDVEPVLDTRPIEVRFEDKVNNSWRNVASKKSVGSTVGGVGRDNSAEAMSKRMADARLLFSGGVMS